MRGPGGHPPISICGIPRRHAHCRNRPPQQREHRDLAVYTGSSNVHCVIPAGGLSPDHSRWIHPKYHFFLPVKVLSRVFRGKFVAGLKRLFRQKKRRFQGELEALEQPKAFHSFLRQLFSQDWVDYAKPPFGGPGYVLQYLARYTHRVAISNHRLITFGEWRSYLPMEGLCARQQEAQNEGYVRRIPAPLSTACIAAWLCAHPSLRVSGPTTAARVDSGLPPGSGASALPAAPGAGSNGAVPQHLALSVLWRPHDHPGEAHGPADPLELCRMELHEHLIRPHRRGPNSMPPRGIAGLYVCQPFHDHGITAAAGCGCCET